MQYYQRRHISGKKITRHPAQLVLKNHNSKEDTVHEACHFYKSKLVATLILNLILNLPGIKKYNPKSMGKRLQRYKILFKLSFYPPNLSQNTSLSAERLVTFVFQIKHHGK
jgi:hypothetical protein